MEKRQLQSHEARDGDRYRDNKDGERFRDGRDGQDGFQGPRREGCDSHVMGAVSDFLEIKANGIQSRTVSSLEVRISGRSRIARGREINLKSEMCVR